MALTTGSLIAAALLLGTVVSTWQAILAERARTAETAQREVAERQRIEAQKQRGLAEANLETARQAVDEYFTLVSESKLLDVPGMQPLRKELLEAALRYYQTMLDEQADDPAVLADLAMAQLRTANVYHELGRVNDALSAVDTALGHVERLRRDYPDSIEHQRRLAGFWNVHRHASSSNETIKDLDAAHRTLVRFLQVWETLGRENPSVEAFQNDVASINLLLSLLEGTRGGAGEEAAFTRAAAYANQAVALWEQLSQAHPERPTHRENLAFVYNELSYALGRAGQQDAAREAAVRSAALRETLIAQSPNLPTYRELAAGKLSSVAAGLALTQPQEAEAAYRRAVEAWQKLAADFPAAPQYALELSGVQGKLVELLAGPLKRPDEAIQMSRELVDLLAKLVAENPEAPSLGREAALTRRVLANRLLVSKENWSEAEDLHLQSLADFKKLADEFPEEQQHVEQAGHSYRYLGWIARDLARLDAAADYFEQGVAAFQKLADGKAPHKYAFYRDFQADTSIELALVLGASKKLDAAEVAAAQGAEVYEALLRDHPESVDYRQKTSRALRVLSTQLDQQDKLAEALVAARKSARLAPNDFYAHGQLHHVLSRMGNPEQTLVVLRDNIAAMPDSPMARHYLGVALEQQGRHEEAIAEFRRTLELSPTWEWPHLCMANNYAALGEWDTAAVEYARCFEMDPGSWWKVVDSLKAKGQLAESEKVLRRLLAIADKRADDAQGRDIRKKLEAELEGLAQ